MGIKIEKLNDHLHPYDNAQVRVRLCGNIIETRYCTTDMQAPILKLSNENYVELKTGEVKEFEHTAETRADNLSTIKRSMSQLRDLINTNVVDSKKSKFLTLTYARNETDPKIVYKDFNKFWKRFQYYCTKNNIEIPNYIDVLEPQGRGSFHHHLIMIFSRRAPFIDNAILADIWQHGFTKTKKLENVDNVGAYLTAYLADLPIEDAIHTNTLKGDLKAVEATTEDGKKVPKAVVKGGRLNLYPSHVNFYRTSRGIKRPITIDCTERHAQEMIGDAPMIFEKTVEVTEDGNHINTINYRVYNKARKGNMNNGK